LENNFKFYVEADLIKSEGKDEPWMVGGLASTDSEDSQKETLDYNGFELTDLKWINWNHGKDPKDLIGQVITKKIKKGEGLYITGELFKSKEQAKEAYQTMCDLNKSATGTKLSWSVEGKVISRDPKNPKKVTKARLFQVALCPTPVNGDTWADLVQKGFTNSEDMSKAMDLETTESIHKESVDHNPKDLEDSTRNTKKEKNKRVLKKSEIYNKIFNNFTKSYDKADKIYELIKSIDMEVTNETIEKAKQILNLAEEKEEKEEVQKSEESQENTEEQEVTKAEKVKVAVKGEEDEDEEEEEKEEKVEKTYDKKDMKKGEIEDLIKSLSDSLGSQISSVSDLVKSNDAKFKALGQIVLSQEEANTELKKSINELTERLGKVEDTPIKKSVTVDKYKERFEKGEGDQIGSLPENTFSLSKSESKEQLMETMLELCGANGEEITDPVIAKGISELEVTGQLGEKTLLRLQAKGIKVFA
jgi:hypothetical protein